MCYLNRWSFAFLLSVIFVRAFSFPIETESGLNCPSVAFCECSINTQYEIACPSRIDANITLRVEPQRSTNRVEIECNAKNVDILNLLPEWNIGNSDVVKFKDCPVEWNASIRKIFNWLHIQNVRSLIFFAQTTPENKEKTLPQTLFSNVEHVKSLDLRSGKMRLPKNIFENFYDLESLQIDSTDFSNAPYDLFQHLSKLKRLQLWNNDFKRLSKQMFVGVSSVIDLEINSNNIKELVGNAFEHFTAVESINLNGNRLNTLPRQLFTRNKAVQRIRISHNHMNNDLHTLPRQFFGKLPKLEGLWINDCRLMLLPDDLLLESKSIQNISFAYNNLTKIPSTIFKHQVNLLELDLSFNELRSLDDDLFSETRNLIVLRLSYNRLTNISRSLISDLKHLQFLYLDNNNLHTIHMTALDGTGLRVLHLQNNMLHFKNFDETNWDETNWDVENVSPFQTLHQLEELNMRNNSMTTFLHDWHTSNLALSKLDVSNNKIELLNFRFIFNNWTNPIRINVSHNNIKTLHVDHDFTLIENESQVEWILNNNPLQCDCLLIHFATALRNQSSGLQKNRIKFITNHLKCATPQQFIDQPLENIPLTDFTCSLPHTDCPNQCSCYVRPVDAAAVYNCSNANLTKIPDIQSIRQYLGLKLQLIELYIENNNITSLEMGNLTGYKYVNRIYAKNNFIENIHAEHFPDNLMVLDLSGNKLKRISSEALDKLSHMNKLQNISFGENPWICDCMAYASMKSIKNNFAKMINANDFMCESDKELNLIDAKHLCPIDKTPILIFLITLVALISLLTTFFYMKRQEIMVWLFAKNATWFFGKQSHVDCNKEYDAFIWYATLDEKFVANDVMPQLENVGSKSLKICLLVREMQGGDIIPEQIAKCVEKSRQTIVILSPNSTEYFDKLKQSQSKGEYSDTDIWGLMGFRVAHQKALNEKRSRVIIITKGDIGRIKHFQSEIRAYLSANINLRWGEKRFFDKLRLAIAHPKYFKDNHYTNTIV